MQHNTEPCNAVQYTTEWVRRVEGWRRGGKGGNRGFYCTLYCSETQFLAVDSATETLKYDTECSVPWPGFV